MEGGFPAQPLQADSRLRLPKCRRTRRQGRLISFQVWLAGRACSSGAGGGKDEYREDREGHHQEHAEGVGSGGQYRDCLHYFDFLEGAPDNCPGWNARNKEEVVAMQFVVSEQASTNTAIVHRCSCRKAQGQENRSLDVRVHGPFATGEQALSAATRTGRKRVRSCTSCRP